MAQNATHQGAREWKGHTAWAVWPGRSLAPVNGGKNSRLKRRVKKLRSLDGPGRWVLLTGRVWKRVVAGGGGW